MDDAIRDKEAVKQRRPYQTENKIPGKRQDHRGVRSPVGRPSRGAVQHDGSGRYRNAFSGPEEQTQLRQLPCAAVAERVDEDVRRREQRAVAMRLHHANRRQQSSIVLVLRQEEVLEEVGEEEDPGVRKQLLVAPYVFGDVLGRCPHPGTKNDQHLCLLLSGLGRGVQVDVARQLLELA